MQVLVVRRDRTGVRQINLAATLPVFAALTLGAVLVVAGFFAGQVTSERSATGADLAEVRALREALAADREHIARLEQETEDTLDALAIRLGRMNAHVIRLDALGQRLTEMAELEDGEFDFDATPPIGGPLEPETLGGGSVADIHQSLDSLSDQLSNREKQLGVLESMLMSRNLTQRTLPEGRPVTSGWLSSYYGKRTDPFTGKPAWHKGVDFAGKHGDEIVAVAAGVVTYSGNRFGYGEMVEIDHGKGYVTRYAHNSSNTVAVGDEVDRGQVIAAMGASGRATGPNLHFEVLYRGKPVDPLKFIRGESERR